MLRLHQLAKPLVLQAPINALKFLEKQKEERSLRRKWLNRTQNIGDSLAKTPSQAEEGKFRFEIVQLLKLFLLKFFLECRKLILSDSKGIAIVLNQSSGVLEPFEMKELTAVVYNNMWGIYKDVITIDIQSRFIS